MIKLYLGEKFLCLRLAHIVGCWMRLSTSCRVVMGTDSPCGNCMESQDLEWLRAVVFDVQAWVGVESGLQY